MFVLAFAFVSMLGASINDQNPNIPTPPSFNVEAMDYTTLNK